MDALCPLVGFGSTGKLACVVSDRVLVVGVRHVNKRSIFTDASLRRRYHVLQRLVRKVRLVHICILEPCTPMLVLGLVCRIYVGLHGVL